MSRRLRYVVTALLFCLPGFVAATGCGDAPSNATPEPKTEQELKDYAEQMRKANGGR